MGINGEKLKKMNIVGTVTTIIAVIAFIICVASKDDIVINQGIRFYKSLRVIMLVVVVVSAVFSVITMILRIANERKTLEKQAEMESSREADLRKLKRAQAKLSVDGEMDAASVKELLLGESRGRWSSASDNIYQCVEQMEQMDSYQARLQKLLFSNGADALKDTEDVLDQVEQYLCKNVRSALNFMGVADDADLDKVREKLAGCREENKKLLDQTRDFVYAMAEFLNDQGGKTDLRLLETYKGAILSSIKGGAL